MSTSQPSTQSAAERRAAEAELRTLIARFAPGLWEQSAGAATKMTGPSGAQAPEVVASAIASAIEDPTTPLRVPVGQDTQIILGLRSSLDDQALEAAMRKAIGFTW